jgi:molecular chaperone GrpE (heat shock protein)
MEFSLISNKFKSKKTVDSKFTINENEEQCVFGDKKINPSSEAYILIKQACEKNKKHKKEIEGFKKKENKMLGSLATEVFGFFRYIADSKEKGFGDKFKGFELIQNRMQEILEKDDIEIIDPTGKALNNELLNQVEVLKYIKEEGVLEPVVKETINPLIYRKGKLIQLGVVIGAIPLKNEGGKNVQ